MDRNSFYAKNRNLPEHVALRKESVDRNDIRIAPIDGVIESLSARRAWIEITVVATLATLVTVALRKESVDRNIFITSRCSPVSGRSPQGERG